METALSAAAWRIARIWADQHNVSPSEVTVRGYARQAQDHLSHGADPEHLWRVAVWTAREHPGTHDLDLGMRFAAAPRPPVVARNQHVCVCRGGAVRSGGAPAPAMLRQLIRRPASRAA